MSSVITTDFERWKAQEAALGKPVALNEFVFANVPGLDPSKDISRDEKLPPSGQIVHRQAVNKAGLASENAVAYSVTLGTDTGDFVFNWIGLINKESGTLAMITHAPEQRKIKTVDGVQGNVITRSFLLEFNGAATETQITTSAETWQIDFTARLAGMDEIQRLANRDIYGTAAFFGDGFLVTKAAEQYHVTPGTAYIEGLRGTLEEITTFNNLRDTKIYADFTFQGNLVSKWQTFVKVTTAKTLAHYQDTAGFQHYVAVIAEIDKNGNITDKRVKGTATDRELAELKKDLPETYQPKGDYVSESDLNNKINNDDIVHVPGTSKTKIMSQSGATKAFADAAIFFSSSNQAGVRPSESSDISLVTLSTGHVGVWSNTAGEFLWYFTGSKMMKGEVPLSLVTGFRESFVGMTTYFMHRSAQLPAGWYSINGDRYSVSSPQGAVIKSLPAQLKSDWKITESGGMINLPDPRFTDGRMPFPRPVNGTSRQVGTIEDDITRKITGGLSGVQFKNTSAPSGAFQTSIQTDVQGTALEPGTSSIMRVTFDSSRVVNTGTENKPLDIGVTWAIYLGV